MGFSVRLAVFRRKQGRHRSNQLGPRDLRDQIRSGVPMPTPRGKSPTAKLIPEPEDVPPLSAEKLELREKFGRAMGLR
jgi:hypothetical protein